MPGQGFRSLFKAPLRLVIPKVWIKISWGPLQHPIYSNRDHSASKFTKEEIRAWLENLISSGRASVGIDMSHIHHDFENFTSKPLDYKSLHRGSLKMFILEFGDLSSALSDADTVLWFSPNMIRLCTRSHQWGWWIMLRWGWNKYINLLELITSAWEKLCSGWDKLSQKFPQFLQVF